MPMLPITCLPIPAPCPISQVTSLPLPMYKVVTYWAMDISCQVFLVVEAAHMAMPM